MKKHTEKTLERLNKKANKEYRLGICPRCDEDMNPYSLEHYIGEEIESYYICEKCNLFITHIYTWISTEVEQHKE